MRFTCGGCEATWGGLGRAHCAGCHQTFSVVSLFDKHRSTRGPHGSCREPGSMRTKSGAPVMVLGADGLWRGPSGAVLAEFDGSLLGQGNVLERPRAVGGR
jgi:hypothetical protein